MKIALVATAPNCDHRIIALSLGMMIMGRRMVVGRDGEWGRPGRIVVVVVGWILMVPSRGRIDVLREPFVAGRGDDERVGILRDFVETFEWKK